MPSANAPGMSTVHPMIRNVTACRLIFYSGKPSAGQRHVDVKNTTFGAYPMRMKKHSKLILKNITMACGVCIASSEDLAVKLSELHRLWIKYICHCFINFIYGVWRDVKVHDASVYWPV